MDSTIPESLRTYLVALAETHPNAAHARATMEQAETEIARVIGAATLAERARCAGIAEANRSGTPYSDAADFIRDGIRSGNPHTCTSQRTMADYGDPNCAGCRAADAAIVPREAITGRLGPSAYDVAVRDGIRDSGL